MADQRRSDALRSMQDEWAEIDRRYDELRASGAQVEPYRFRREDAYEERLGRHGE